LDAGMTSADLTSSTAPERQALPQSSAGTQGASEPATSLESFILERELAEVHLLLDNVSTMQDKTLPESIPGAGDEKWIETVCNIQWPPEGTKADRANQAAQLLRARDALNRAASPASGLTIAFTVLVVGDERDSKPGFLRRIVDRLFGYSAAEADPERNGTYLPDKGRIRSRNQLARKAFPGLIVGARHFRFWLHAILLGLIFWLAATCLLSWDVAIGNALASRVAILDASGNDIANQMAALDVDEGLLASQAEAPAPSSTDAGKSPPADQSQKARDRLAFAKWKKLRDDRDKTATLHAKASDNLRGWMDGRWWKAYWFNSWLPCVLVRPDCVPTTVDDGRGNKVVNWQWAAAVIAIMANTVLPVFYGVLGAGAAVIRNLSAKIRDSVLAPRHLRLALIQLTLGAVIGACIGLSVSPSGGGDGAGAVGLLKQINLTAPALCFVAGFGVEGVFQALESLISRIFNTPLNTTPPSTPK
jgi:hypothetical protein